MQTVSRQFIECWAFESIMKIKYVFIVLYIRQFEWELFNLPTYNAFIRLTIV
jgi:hypothetical protein